MLRKLFVLCSALTLISPAIAQSQAPVALSYATSKLIKRYDPTVSPVILVSPAAPGAATACGEMPEMNAIYCSADKKVYFGADLMQKAHEEYGPMAAIVVTAHEYAHARQHAKTGFITPLGYTVANELQADCLAGVYLKKASPIQFADYQIEQASVFVQALGDYQFFSMDWHGTPEMRSSVFKYGYKVGDMNACIAGDEANWNLILAGSQDALRQILDNSSEITRPIIKDLFDYIGK